ncbi:MAG TPA: PAS domain-containing protein, partial [Allocoleopsis sp.]
MPILLGIIATIAVLGVWQQLSLQENHQIEQIVAEKAALTETLLTRELADRIQGLQRIADRWQVSGGISQPLWEADAATYIRDLPGFQAIEWVDPAFHVRWVVPLAGNEAVQNLDLSQEFHRHNTLRISRELRQPFLSGMVALMQGGNGFLASVPIFLGEKFEGFILGVFWNPAFFDSVLLVPEGFRVCVYDHGRLMYSSGGVQQTPFKKTVELEAYEVNWQVDVFPTPVFVAAHRTLLPRVVLFGGLMGSWTLALTAYLGQRSAHYAYQVRKTNQQLQAEIVERERVEATLRESEERLFLALEAAHEGWWDWNLITNKVERSPQYLHLLGYEVGEFPETFESWETAVYPSDLPKLRNHLLAHLQNSAVPYACEYRLRTKSGDWLWIADYGKVVNRDKHHQPLRMIGTFKDISERKATEAALRQSEASLRQSEEKFRQLAENIRAVFWMSDPVAARVLYVSPAFEAIWGYSCEALYQDFSLWLRSIHPDDRARIEQAQIADVFQGTYDEEYRIIRPDGSIRWIHDRGFPVKIPNAESQRIAGIAEDITNRKQAEIALARELLRSQTFFNTSIDGVVLMSYQGDVIQTSPSFAHMLGYSVEEALTLNVKDWEAQWTPKELQSLLQKKELPPLFETKHRRKDGSLYDVEVSYSQVELEGEHLHFCICRNISDRKRIEGERQQAEQALRQSEATNQAIIQAIPDLLIRMRADGSYIEFISNSKFNIVSPEQQRHNTNLRNILPPELAEQRLYYTQQALESGKTKVYEHEILIQGKQCYEEVRIVPLMTDEVLVMVRDITDHKHAETALQLSEERLQLALEASGDGLWDWNLATGEIYLSPRYQEMLGYAPHESVITSEEWKHMIHPDDQPWVLQCLDEYLQDSLVRYSFDYRIRCKSGAWKWIADYGKIVARDHQGKPLRMIGTYKDISDRKQKELA